jgi:hypothetical protein
MGHHEPPSGRLRGTRIERRPSCGRGRPDDTLSLLLAPRELYVGHLSDVSLGIWRVGLEDGETVHIGAPPQRAGAGAVPLSWAAGALLEEALGRRAGEDVVDALARELTRVADRRLVLYDVEVRLWYLYWQLVSQDGG